VILLFLLGCPTLVESHCELNPHEVDDDERLAVGFTVAGALSDIAPQTVVGIDLFGEPVSVDVALTRGEGAALFEDADAVDVVTRPGTNDVTQTTWLGPDPCQDAVEVPVVLTLVGEGVSAGGPATLRAVLGLGDAAGDAEGVRSVEYALDPAADTLPAGLGGAPVSGTVWVDYRDGVVTRLEAVAVTADGARETVIWYNAE
jgi:hypothetical protein